MALLRPAVVNLDDVVRGDAQGGGPIGPLELELAGAGGAAEDDERVEAERGRYARGVDDAAVLGEALEERAVGSGVSSASSTVPP